MFSTTQSMTVIIKLIHKIMKNFLFTLVLILIGSFSFANKQTVLHQNSSVIETNKKYEVIYDIGNITNLTDAEIDTICYNIVQNVKNTNNLDECTVTLTATVNIGIGSVEVTVSYTAANCELAASKAASALKAAVKKILSML